MIKMPQDFPEAATQRSITTPDGAQIVDIPILRKHWDNFSGFKMLQAGHIRAGSPVSGSTLSRGHWMASVVSPLRQDSLQASVDL